jgi:hypothetical protein
MANNKIQIKRSSVSGRVPTALQLDVGEFAVNLVDNRLFTKNASNTVIDVLGQSLNTTANVSFSRVEAGNVVTSQVDGTGTLVLNQSGAGGFVVIKNNGLETRFTPSGAIEPAGPIAGSSYGSNQVDVTNLGPMQLKGMLYGVQVATSPDNGSTSHVWSFGTSGTLDAPSDITANGTITANTFVGNVDWSYITSKPDLEVSITGDATGNQIFTDLANGSINVTLADTTVTAGTYGNSSVIPVITVDSKGRVTSATTNAVAGITGYSYTSANNTFAITAGDGSVYRATIDTVNAISVSNTLNVTGVGTFSNDVNITGNLTVLGVTTFVNTTELNIGDNIITLNANTTGAPALNAGIEIARGTSSNVSILWNEADDRWTFTEDGTNYVRFIGNTEFDAAILNVTQLAANGSGADTAYSNAVATAATDATNKSANAYSNAVSTAATDATNKAANAYSNAVATSATDATNKAANAYSNAVSTASIDATNKAANAYSNAISFATTAANAAYSNAVAIATNLAANAYSNAITYIDTATATAYSNATSYADTQASTAYSNAVATAATDATDKAANAYSNAVSFATTAANDAYSSAVSYADTAAGAAYSNAVSYADTVADTAYTNAVSFATTAAGDAYSNAVSVAASYTDDKAANAYSNAVSYADTAAATAYSNAAAIVSAAANAAYSNAISYADTAAATAYANAYAAASYFYSTGASFAQAQASNAYSNAVSYAATVANNAYANAVAFATLTSNAAYANAISYIDTAAGTSYSNAVIFATTVANTAYSNAVSTAAADATTKAAAAYSNATSYADTVATTAYNNAVTFATNKAANAYANAIAYSGNAAAAYANAIAYADAQLGLKANTSSPTISNPSFTVQTSIAGNVYLTNTRLHIGGNVGTLGQVLTSGGVGGSVYWSNPSSSNGGGGTTYTLTTTANTLSANVILTGADSTVGNVKFIGNGGIVVSSNGTVVTVDGSSVSGAANGFGVIAVSGQSSIAADQTNDTLTFVAGNNMIITTNASGDTITFSSTGDGGSGGSTGNSAGNAFISGRDNFTGNGSDTSFTMSQTGTANSILVLVEGLVQFHSEDYDVSGTTLTFTTAPLDNEAIEVLHISGASTYHFMQYGAIDTFTGDDTTTEYTLSVTANTSTATVYLDGLLQAPTTDFTISGTTLTFATAPLEGEVVLVYHTEGASSVIPSLAIAGTDTFAGNGVDTDFTITSTADINTSLVTVNGIVQRYGVDYSIADLMLTFADAPPDGSAIQSIRFAGSVGTAYRSVAVGSSTITADSADSTLTIANNAGVTTTVSGNIISIGLTDIAKQSLTGNGSNTEFTLTHSATADDLFVYVNGIYFHPDEDYTVANTTLTFTVAPVDTSQIRIRFMRAPSALMSLMGDLGSGAGLYDLHNQDGPSVDLNA